MNDILITVCARGGSKGVKGKNARLLLGKPLIYHTIKQAISWNKAERVVVSTDSAEIASIAKKIGADVPFLRPTEFATDFAPKVPVIRHALLECERIFKKQYKIIIDLDVTAPIRTPKDIDNCLELFLKHSPKTLFSVVPSRKNPYFNMIEETDEGLAKKSKKRPCQVSRRQDTPKVYDMNASIYFYSREYLANEQNDSPISDDSRFYIMPDIAGVDIDTEMDFKYIEFLVENGIVAL